MTVADADLVGSAVLVAVTVTVPGVFGAVKRPLELIEPAEALQATPVSCHPVTVAVNCWDAFVSKETVAGLMLTEIRLMTHVPDEQSWSVPQVVPSGLCPTSSHVAADIGEAQAVAPTAHGFSGWHASFATQAGTQAPEEHTRPVPHEAPSGTLPVVVQVPGASGDEQVRAPVLHGFDGWQVAPATQVGGTHEPPLHTFSPPQLVPSGLLPVTTHTASSVRVGQDEIPVVQGFEGWQGTPSVQLTV